MKSHKTIMMLLLSATLLYACSSDNNAETKTGKIDTMTKEIGQEATRVIKTPIDKAQNLADKEEKRTQDLNQQSNQ